MAINAAAMASGGALGNSGALDAASSALGGLGDAIKTLGVAAVGPTAAIVGLGAALNGLVGKANPVVAEQFTRALDDLMAVIGQSLVPIFQTVVIPVVRMAGDALMQLQPAFMALAAAMQPLVPVIGEVFTTAIGVLAEIIKAAAPFVMVFARAIAEVVRFMSDGIKQLLSLIGIDLTPVKAGASVGAAVRQVGHSSVEDVIKQAQRSAFSLGNASADPMAKMANMSEQIKARAEEILKFLQELPQRIWDYMKQLPKMLMDLVTQWWNESGYDEREDPNSMYNRSGGVVVNNPATAVKIANDRFGSENRPNWMERNLGFSF